MGWTMGFGRILRRPNLALCSTTNTSPLNPVLELPDGSRQILYVANDQASFITTTFWRAVCIPTGGMSVYSPDGMRYDMTQPGPLVGTVLTNQQQSWYPTLITDRNGNTLAVTTDPATGGLLTVSASDGRKVTFTYTAGALSSISDGAHTVQYISIAGPSAGYTYLTQVIRPDNASWQYAYHQALDGLAGAGSVTQVTYPGGGTLAYQYGLVVFMPGVVGVTASHAVTAKTASFPLSASWTYSYTPGTTAIPATTTGYSPNLACPSTQLDVTVVTGPEGKTTYCHMGYSGAPAGYGYALGAVIDILHGDPVYSETAMSYAILPVSAAQTMLRGDGLVINLQVVAPVPYYKATNSYGQLYQTTFSGFDAYGNPSSIVETGTPLGPNGTNNTRSSTVTYNVDLNHWALHQKKDETISVDNTAVGSILRGFDPNDNLLSETRFGVATSWTYFPTGDIKTKTDARLYTTTYGSYYRGIPQTEAQPEGVNLSRVVDDFGNISSQTDAENVTTGFTFDGMNRVTGITHPTGNPVTVAWLPISRTVTRGNAVEVTNFDVFGRVASVTYPRIGPGLTTTYTTDALGRRIYTDPPGGGGTRVDYDINNRVAAVYQGCSGYAGSCGSARYNFWQANQLLVVDELGNVTTYTYRGFGDADQLQLMTVTTPGNLADVSYQRNGLGQILQATQGAVTRIYQYTPSYFLLNTTDPETGITTYGRDALGNMTSRQVGTSGLTSYTYDGRNRLATTTYPSGTPGVTRTYFHDDLIQSVSNGTASRTYTYYPSKNLQTETLTVGPQSFNTTLYYDANDALASETYPSGQVVTFNPDGLGRPTKALPFVSDLSYWPNGQPETISYANGVQANLTYDVLHRLANATLASAAALFDTSYGYDPAGNVLAIYDAVDASYNRVMQYDPINRLTVVDGSWGSGLLGYDGSGNLKQQLLGTANSLNYQYSPTSNRLLSTTGSRTYAMSYDVYGNVAGNGQQQFRYDDAQTMQCSACGTPLEVDYGYDGLGLRVSAQPLGGAMTYFQYSSAGKLLTEITGQGQTEYFYLNGRQIAIRHSAVSAAGANPVVGGATHLSLSAASNVPAPPVGTEFTVTLSVVNDGAQVATNTRVVETLAPGLTLVGVPAACTQSGQVLSCQAGDLAAGATQTVTLTLLAAQAGTLNIAGSVLSGTVLWRGRQHVDRDGGGQFGGCSDWRRHAQRGAADAAQWCQPQHRERGHAAGQCILRQQQHCTRRFLRG